MKTLQIKQTSVSTKFRMVEYIPTVNSWIIGVTMGIFLLVFNIGIYTLYGKPDVSSNKEVETESRIENVTSSGTGVF